MSCRCVVSGKSIVGGPSIWSFSRSDRSSETRLKCPPTTPCNSCIQSAKSDTLTLSVPKVHRVASAESKLSRGRGGNGFSIAIAALVWVRPCRLSCVNDFVVILVLGLGRVIREAPRVWAISSSITCIGAMYATQFFEHHARTWPQTRP